MELKQTDIAKARNQTTVLLFGMNLYLLTESNLLWKCGDVIITGWIKAKDSIAFLFKDIVCPYNQSLFTAPESLKYCALLLLSYGNKNNPPAVSYAPSFFRWPKGEERIKALLSCKWWTNSYLSMSSQRFLKNTN